MKDNIDKIIKKKYLEVEVPKVELDKLQVRKSYTGYKVAIIVLALVMLTVGAKFINNNDNTNDVKTDNNVQQNIVAENTIKLPEAAETIECGPGIASINADALIKELDYVAIIKVNKILGYTNYSEIQKRSTIPITKFEATVEKALKGNISGTVEINKYGGIISMADWEKTFTEEKKEQLGYNNIPIEEKENTYINICNSVTMGWADVKENGTYLVFLKEDAEVYGGLMVVGYLKEYDETTQSVKSGQTWIAIKDELLIQRALEK